MWRKPRSGRSPGISEVTKQKDTRKRLRRAYYRMMNARMDRYEQRRAKQSTPAELMELYGKEGEEEKLRAVTQIYEEARYSDEVCTAREVQKMKDWENNMTE